MTEQLTLPELHADGRIRIDRWGLAHIDASDAHDVFVLQGYTAARMRLFQLDLWRRRGLGLVAEAFGPAYVERDIAARHYLYRGDMDAEWAAYGEGAKDAATAFVAGVNAFIARALAGDEPLPPEFALLGHEPGRWAADDIARIRLHGLFDNARSELARARTLRDFGAEADDLRRVREPATPVVLADPAVLDAVFDEALAVYDLATSPVAIAGAPSDVPPLAEGSNNWVIGPGRTRSGRPILANDPHRVVSNPSLRLLVHLRCPEFDVIGAGEPMLPGVSIGHNGRVAFGLTIFPTDQEDVYLYDLDADGRYLHDGAHRAFDTVTESVPVRGEDPREAVLRFTVHGPVSGVSPDGRRAAVVRAAWLASGMAPYLGSLRYLRATDAAQFRDALAHWGAPTVNQVFADVDGRIGWQACGFVPARTWDGLTPVPGDGRFEWDGFRPPGDFPGVVDPEQGWWATANQRNVGEDPVSSGLSAEWLAPYRFQRIAEVLADDLHATIEGSVALQGDVLSIPAQQVLAALVAARPAVAELLSGEPGATAVVGLLCEWDAGATAGSIAAGVFEAWLRGPLRRRLRVEAARDLGRPDDEALVRALDPSTAEEMSGDARVDLALLARYAAEGTRIAGILADTLLETARHFTDAAGPAPSDWALGERQHAFFRHPASAVAPGGWAIDPVPRGGTPDTVNVVARSAAGEQTVGASVRVVIDVGDWDASRAVNAPGQSGVPGSPHYADLVDLWAAGETFPLSYSDAAIARVTAHDIAARPVEAEHPDERSRA